jgi:prepilin-type N-terminal cleavage/methylation domain-containing protein
MITHLKKNNGFTLIELLAAMSIFSIVMILLYGVLSNGMDYSKKSMGNVSVQQELNILITTMTKIHETYPSYDIIFDHNPDATSIKLLGKDDTGRVVYTNELSTGNHTYSLMNYQGDSEVFLSTVTTVDTSQPLYIKCKIHNTKHPDQKAEIKTIISRL